MSQRKRNSGPQIHTSLLHLKETIKTKPKRNLPLKLYIKEFSQVLVPSSLFHCPQSLVSTHIFHWNFYHYIYQRSPNIQVQWSFLVLLTHLIFLEQSLFFGILSFLWFLESIYLILLQYAAAKSLQSCPTLCDPIDGSPRGSPIPGILQARTLEWVAISFSNAWKWKVKVKSLSRVRLFPTPWTAAYQTPPWDFPGKSTGVGCHCLLHESSSNAFRAQADNINDWISL